MTENERKLQRASLYVEWEDACSDFAHLQDKGIDTLERLGKVNDWLRSEVNRQPSPSDLTGSIENLEIRTESKYQEYVDFAKLSGLVDELRKARQRVEVLNQRKKNMGMATW